MSPIRKLNMTIVGPLHSTGVTLLLRYHQPLRLPADQLIWLLIPIRPPGYKPQSAGSPRFLDHSFTTRCPLSPRWVSLVHLLIASQAMLASSHLADWPPTTRVSRPKSVQSLRLAVSLSSASAPSLESLFKPISLPVLRYLHTTDRSYMSNQQLHGNHLAGC